MAYSSACASDSIPSDTSTKFDNDVWLAIYALTLLQALIKSSFLAEDKIDNIQGIFFEVPARWRHQKSIYFGRTQTEIVAKDPNLIFFDRTKVEFVIHEDSEDQTRSPDFSNKDSKGIRMMKYLGYDFKKKLGPNFVNEMRTRLHPFIPKRKDISYYHETRRGLRCVNSNPSDSKYEESVYHDHSSSISSWELDVSVGAIFESTWCQQAIRKLKKVISLSNPTIIHWSSTWMLSRTSVLNSMYRP